MTQNRSISICSLVATFNYIAQTEKFKETNLKVLVSYPVNSVLRETTAAHIRLPNDNS